MHLGAKPLLTSLLAAVLALSGCFGVGGGGGHSHDDLACPDGQVVPSGDVADAPGHDDDGFNATSLCPASPKVNLTVAQSTVSAYRPATYTWTLDAGAIEHGHSMLSRILWSSTSVADSALSNLTSLDDFEGYPNEFSPPIKKEHQDLPKAFNGTFTFTAPGTVYIRAFAEIKGDLPNEGGTYAERVFASPEVFLEVTAVEPTGDTHNIVYNQTDLMGPSTTELTINLGDGVAIQNGNPLQEHECTSETAGNPGAITAGGGATGTAVVFDVPGAFEYTCDGLQGGGNVLIRVNTPA